MNYYEAHEPYYALIQAETKEIALTEYVAQIAEDDDGHLSDNMKQVATDYAIARYSRTFSEELQEVPLSEILENIRSNDTMVLIFDANLA